MEIACHGERRRAPMKMVLVIIIVTLVLFTLLIA